MDKKDFALMNKLMSGITTADEWDTAMNENPAVARKDADLNGVMEKVKRYLPHDLYMELADARVSALNAYIDLAILYGIRVANVIRDAAEHPAEFSQYIVERMGGEVSA